MSKRALFAIALMLFSMFFGAGNLIFPPMLGANAGDNFVPAVTGFLISGVALPVLAIIAIALSGQDIRALAARAGTVFPQSPGGRARRRRSGLTWCFSRWRPGWR